MPRNGRDQINIAVDPDLKADWEQAIEETGRYDSMTQLIRQSVENELIRIGFREGIDVDIPSQSSQPADVDLSGFEAELSEVKEELRGVSQRIERISLATDAQQDTELMELASRGTLPTSVRYIIMDSAYERPSGLFSTGSCCRL